MIVGAVSQNVELSPWQNLKVATKTFSAKSKEDAKEEYLTVNFSTLMRGSACLKEASEDMIGLSMKMEHCWEPRASVSTR